MKFSLFLNRLHNSQQFEVLLWPYTGTKRDHSNSVLVSGLFCFLYIKQTEFLFFKMKHFTCFLRNQINIDYVYHWTIRKRSVSCYCRRKINPLQVYLTSYVLNMVLT